MEFKPSDHRISVVIIVLVSLSSLFTTSSSSITLPPYMSPSQFTNAPSPLHYNNAPSALGYYADSPLGASPHASHGAYETFPDNYKPPSGVMAKVKKVCQVVPNPDECAAPYDFSDGYTSEDDVTPFNVFMKMVRDVQTSIWIAEAVWTGLRKASLERADDAQPRNFVAAARERVRARALGACKDLYGKAAAEMEDINEYNYGIDYNKAHAHTDEEYTEAAEKIVDDVFEATFPAAERCRRAARNAFVGAERREAVYGEVAARNEEIKRKYANCKAMAEFMAGQRGV